MSRGKPRLLDSELDSDDFVDDRAARADATHIRIKTAKEISIHALELATRARSAGLTALGHLLETAALEAAATAIWREDAH